MRTFLRRSSQFVQLPRSSPHAHPRIACYPQRSAFVRQSLCGQQSSRAYASVKPDDPKKPEEDQKDVDKQIAGDKQPGKPAQGFDNVYNNKSSISSSSQTSQNEPHQHRGPSTGN